MSGDTLPAPIVSDPQVQQNFDALRKRIEEINATVTSGALTQADLDNHAADTTAVHGIPDTSTLMQAGDPPQAHTHNKAEVTGLQADLDALDSDKLDATDTKVPTQNENDALQGTSGAPSATNRYVTDADPRNADARDPTPHMHPLDEIEQSAAADYEVPMWSPLANGGSGGWVPGLLTGLNFPPYSITGAMIEDGAIDTVHLQTGAVTTDAIATDALDGRVITGTTIRTDSAGERVELDGVNDDITLYNDDEEPTSRFSGENGQEFFITFANALLASSAIQWKENPGAAVNAALYYLYETSLSSFGRVCLIDDHDGTRSSGANVGTWSEAARVLRSGLQAVQSEAGTATTDLIARDDDDPYWTGIRAVQTPSASSVVLRSKRLSDGLQEDRMVIDQDGDSDVMPWIPRTTLSGEGAIAYDGKLLVLQTAAMATDAVRWQLQWNDAANRWEFVGGCPLFDGPQGSMTHSLTSEAALTGGPSLTIPATGVYRVRKGIFMRQDAAGAYTGNCGISINGAAYTGSVVQHTGSAVSDGANVSNAEDITFTAGDVVTLRVKNQLALAYHYSNGWIELHPRYLT